MAVERPRSPARLLAITVIWLSVALAVGAFFLPWVRLEADPSRTQLLPHGSLQAALERLTRRVGKVDVEIQYGTKTVSGEMSDLSKIPTLASGFEIPRLADRQDVVMAVAIAEMLTGRREFGQRSELVYLFPGCAVLAGLALMGWRNRPATCGLIALACLVVSAIGSWKLSRTHAELLMMIVRIEPGLWLSMWAYLGLGLGAAALSYAGARTRA